MHGHGSPTIGSLVLRRGHTGLLALLCRSLITAAFFAALPSTAFSQQDLDIRLRVTWGGEQHRTARGAIFLSDGMLSDVRRLGLEPDLPGAMQVHRAQIFFWERSPTSFDGLEFRVETKSDATVTVQLSSAAERPETFTITLAEFLKNSSHLYRAPLGGGHQLHVRRPAADRIRFHTDSSSLVFAPGTDQSIRIEPKQLGLPAGTSVRLEARLVDRQRHEHWRAAPIDLEIDAHGDAGPIAPLIVPMPRTEGVFSFEIDLVQRRFANALMPNKSLVHREVQVAVVGSQPLRASELNPAEQPWTRTAINLADPEGWERWIPQFSLQPGARRGQIGAPLKQISHNGQAYFELGPSEWTAAPLPTSEPGLPHLLEVVYPNDIPQTVTLSIVEPNAAGVVVPIFLDSGIDVDQYPPPEVIGPETHRLVFWPRTKNPWLLITNRRDNAPAVLGQLQVAWGPQSLPPITEPPIGGGNTRLLAVYYDKPLFPQNLMSAEALEPSTSPARSLNDWNTFFDGGKRLIEYLRYVGYNAAIISVFRDGSALYPSPLVESTPRFDNGVFFVNGQDPRPKDVLEMMFRQFDQAGLTLIPAFHFATPLPELEQQRRNEQTQPGIVLRNSRGDEYVSLFGTRRGLAPYYNPLDERVQAAIKRVVDEVVDRYSHHSSFGGISLQVGPETYVQLPDTEWGQDRRTVARFQASTGAGHPADKDHQQAWLDWRATVLAQFYRDLTADLSRRNPQNKLYLAMAGTTNSKLVRQEMKPQLLGQSDFVGVMLRQGFDAVRLGATDQIVALRPTTHAPLTDLAFQGPDLVMNRSQAVARFYQAFAAQGAMNFHAPLNLRLPEFDAVSPFGDGTTTTWLSAHIPPAGSRNRARFTNALVSADAKALVEGGAMIPLGQEHTVRKLYATYLQLPDGDFATVAAEGSPPTVAVRTLTLGPTTYCYVVNSSPSPAEITLEIEAEQRFGVRSLDGREVQNARFADGRCSWTVRLSSFDLRAVTFNSPNVNVVTWSSQFHQGLQPAFQREFLDINARINQDTSPALPVLVNPGFDLPKESGKIPGWNHSRYPNVSIDVDSHGARGTQSLHMKVTNPRAVGWVRCEEFPIPKSGRISVRAYVRTASLEQQPALRIAVDLLTPGKSPDYEYAALGIDVNEKTGERTPDVPVYPEWRPFLFHLTDLPTDGPSKVAVGFDLVGEGEVWIDDVQVYNVYFDKEEQQQLITKFAIADDKVKRGKLSEAHVYRDGFWPRFILGFVPRPTAPRMATRLRTVSPVTPTTETEQPEDPPLWQLRWPQLPVKLPFRR